MDNGIVVSEDLTSAYSEDTGILMRTGATMAARAAGSGRAASEPVPTTPVVDDASSAEIAKWGEDNLFPQNVWKEVEQNTIIPTTLQKKADMWYGGGLIYGKLLGFDKNGNEELEYKAIPEVDDFFRRSRITRYAYECLSDIATWGMAFPELVLSADRTRINAISTQEAMFCRFTRPNTSGVVENVHVSANWHKGISKGIETGAKVPVVDPYYDPAENLRGRGNVYKAIYPLSVPSPGKTLYQVASWNSVRLSGWLEVVQAIPEFKRQLFKNQISVKYLIEVNREYWDWKYQDWASKTVDERKKIIADELKTFNEVMMGTNGAGKSIMTITVVDPATKKEFSGWKITPIDDKLKDGVYIEDSQEGASHIYTALGLPLALSGIMPGKGMGAGSGSDARVAFNNYISTSRFYLDLAVEPLELVRDYNGWDPALRFRFRNPLIMTLDKGKEVQQQAA